MKITLVAVILLVISTLGVSDEPKGVWRNGGDIVDSPQKVEVLPDIRTTGGPTYPYEDFVYKEAKKDIEEMLDKLRERKL